MEDQFTRRRTFIQGRRLPVASERTALQDDHRRRLEALARVGEAAIECGLRADSDRDLVLLAEDEVSLLKGADAGWQESCVFGPTSLTAWPYAKGTPKSRAGGIRVRHAQRQGRMAPFLPNPVFPAVYLARADAGSR